MATHHPRGRGSAAAAAAASPPSSSSSSSPSTTTTKVAPTNHHVLTTVHLHDITMAVSTNQRARSDDDVRTTPSQPSSPSSSSSSQVMAAVQRLRQRIMSADTSGDHGVHDDDSSSRAYIHPDADLTTSSSSYQAHPHEDRARTPIVEASPRRYDAKSQQPPVCAPVCPRSQEPSLYEAIFGANVARRLQAKPDAAPTPAAPRQPSPPQTPKRPQHSLSYASASPQRSGLSAKLHHLSSLPQLGSPERARRGGPPAGIDPHNSPSQEAMDREEEMAFSHPHQSFVVYSPGRRPRPAVAAPHTPRKRQRVEGASPRYHDGPEETDRVASVLATLADERNRSTPRAAPATPHAAPSTPSSSRHTFADPSSITPRRARVASTQQAVTAPSEDALAANVLLGFASSPTPPRNAATPPKPHATTPSLLNSLERRKSTYHPAPGRTTLFEDCRSAVLQPAANITPPRDPQQQMTAAPLTGDSSSGSSSSAHHHGTAPGPRTPSPTPSSAPRTPHTSSGFAYSEFVNVSPSPQPRSRGPSGRFVNFADGDGWDQGQETVLTPGAFASAFGSPVIRRYRQTSFDPVGSAPVGSPTLSAASRQRKRERQYD